MREERGNLWDRHEKAPKPGILGGLGWVGITTNGIVGSDGRCVMGRGCAREAALRYPELPKKLGFMLIGEEGAINMPYFFPEFSIFTIPVKHNWRERADISLIKHSLEFIAKFAGSYTQCSTYYIPRPGCGNGGLDWGMVKPAIEPLLDDRFVVMTF